MKLTILLIFVLIPSITALKCYKCNSIEDKRCEQASELTEEMTETCFNNEKSDDIYCRRIDQIIDGKKSVVRACGKKTGSKSCYKTAGANSANVCSCNNQDLCNRAVNFPRQQQNLIAIISSIIGLTIGMIVLR